MRTRTPRTLSGRTALVTGASGAFGGATLTVLRHLGVKAIGLDRKTDDGVLGCDIADATQVRQVVPEAVDRLGGRLDLLVHFAGIGPATDIGAEPDGQVHETLEVNLLGAWRVTAAAMPALLAARGRVILTASLLAGVTLPLCGAYTVSKRALTAYADVLRTEYGTHIGVTTVYPGYADTPIHDRSRAVGVSLDGLVPVERVRDTAMTVVRAAASRRAPRDLACTRLGTAALRLSRHLPGALDRAVVARLAQHVRTGRFAGAELAYGMHQRHTDPGGEPR